MNTLPKMGIREIDLSKEYIHPQSELRLHAMTG